MPDVPNHSARLEAELQTQLDRFFSLPPLVRFRSGDITVAHYAAHQRQNFYQLRERPAILGVAAARFSTSRKAAKLLHKRAVEECFHDQQALSDLRAMGVGTDTLDDELPLPETSALLAFGHYQVERLNPVTILGSMYFLDLAPIHAASAASEALDRIGVPGDARSVIYDHETVGEIHRDALEVYVEELVKTEGDLEAVLYGMGAMATLYGSMIGAAFDSVDRAG